MLRANLAATLDKREHGFLARAADVVLVALAAVLVLFATADESLVRLDRLTLPAERPRAFRVKLAHGLADTMRHEPSRAIGAEPQHPPKLMGANALL